MPQADGHRRGKRPEGYWHDDQPINQAFNCIESHEGHLRSLDIISISGWLIAFVALIVAVAK